LRNINRLEKALPPPFCFERNSSKENQGNDSHYGLSCAKPDMQESEVNFLINKQIKLLNVSLDEQEIIQKKKTKDATIGSQKENFV
jgi:hypothetical protein